MKIALIGKGKTGGKVLEHLQEKKIPHTVFDSTNRPSAKALAEHDVIVSFVSGDIFTKLIPVLLESRTPVVTGSTGFEWPMDIEKNLIDSNTCWLYASNFSLGMNLVHKMIDVLAKTDKLFSEYDFKIHEVHHTKKLDSPSGTAITWSNWLKLENKITAERIGDVVGDHTVTLETAHEKVTLRHEALDRKVFAQGAIWAANKIMDLDAGLHSFEDITLKELIK